MAQRSELLVRSARVPGSSVFFLGCHESRVTVLSQQRRALNLVGAILSEGIVRRDGRIAIVGGGASGLTAAAALAVAAPELVIDLFERNDQLLHLQQGSDRYLHPYLYDWPRDGATRTSAGLPILDWEAGTAGAVATKIIHAFREIEARSKKLHVRTQRFIEGIDPFVAGCRVHVSEAPQEGGFYDAAIIAIGFGLEREIHGENKSYWTASPLTGPLPAKPQPILFVSGNGDGGLVDFAMAAFNRMTHTKITDFLVQYPVLQATQEKLLEIEERAWQTPADDLDILAEYERELPAVLPPHILLDVLDRLRPNAEVWLHTRGPRLFRRQTAMLNRFTAFLALRTDMAFTRGAIHFRVGRALVGNLDHGPIDIGEKITPLYRFLRFGPNTAENMQPFQAFSEAYKAAKLPEPGAFHPATPELEEFAIHRTVSQGRRRSRALSGQRVKPHAAAQDLNASEFLARFAQEADLTPIEMDLLKLVNVNSYAEVFLLMRYFPSIAEVGVRLPHISNIAATRLGPADLNVISNNTLDQNPVIVTDVHGTPGTNWEVGKVVPPRIIKGEPDGPR
jgi:hypothetical protein